jgi:hypothetical protein
MPYRTDGNPQRRSDFPSVQDVYFSENVFANNVSIALHKPPGAISGGVYVPIEAFAYEQFHAQTLIDSAGRDAAFDDPESKAEAEAKGISFKNIPDDSLDPVENPVSNDTPASNPAGSKTVCKLFANPINYDEKLSPNFTIRNLTVGATFPHDVQAQNGLSVADILCNLQGLAENILEPLRAKYPGMRINSGFRKGTSGSQHNKGMACDLQWPGLTPEGYNPIAFWIRDNLPIDQLIFEHGKSIWLHISYNRAIPKQRNALLTYYPKVSPQYKPGLTNYYA